MSIPHFRLRGLNSGKAETAKLRKGLKLPQMLLANASVPRSQNSFTHVFCLGRKFDVRNCSLWIGGEVQHRFSPIQKERMMLSLSNSKRIVWKKNILKTIACTICSHWRKIPGSLLIYYHTEGPFYSDDNVKIYCFGNMRVYYTHYCVITPRPRSQHTHIFSPHSSLP